MSKRGRSEGFTLVETVVVMAVILLLAGIVVPALWSGKEVTYTAECQQQLRGIGRAFANYHVDFAGWLPRCDLLFVGVGAGGAPTTQEKVGDKQKIPQENVIWKMQLSVYMTNVTWYDYDEWIRKRRGRLHLDKAFIDPTRGDNGEGVYMASAGQLNPDMTAAQSQTKGSTTYYDQVLWDAAMRELGFENLTRQMTDAEANQVSARAKQLAANPSAVSVFYEPPSLQDFRYLDGAAIVGPSKKPGVHISFTDSLTLTKTETGPDGKKQNAWDKVKTFDKKDLKEFDNMEFRHEGAKIANILFLDGHVIAFTKREGGGLLDLLHRWNKRHEFLK